MWEIPQSLEEEKQYFFFLHKIRNFSLPSLFFILFIYLKNIKQTVCYFFISSKSWAGGAGVEEAEKELFPPKTAPITSPPGSNREKENRKIKKMLFFLSLRTRTNKYFFLHIFFPLFIIS